MFLLLGFITSIFFAKLVVHLTNLKLLGVYGGVTPYGCKAANSMPLTNAYTFTQDNLNHWFIVPHHRIYRWQELRQHRLDMTLNKPDYAVLVEDFTHVRFKEFEIAQGIPPHIKP